MEDFPVPTEMGPWELEVVYFVGKRVRENLRAQDIGP